MGKIVLNLNLLGKTFAAALLKNPAGSAVHAVVVVTMLPHLIDQIDFSATN